MSALQFPEGYAAEADCTCGLNRTRLNPVPNFLLGLDIKEACCIHDFMYGVARTERDRINADKIFLKNLLVIIGRDRKANTLTRLARKAMVYKYYLGVLVFGYPIFHKWF
jgi:hypothetical protein